MIKRTLIGLAAIAMANLAAAADNAIPSLFETFQQPPDEAKPWVYMWRTNLKSTPEDYTRHIEQLRDKGFGGFTCYGWNPPDLAGKPILPHLLKEAERCGLRMGFNNTGSWPAGGYWISKTNLPWATVSSTLDIEGGHAFHGKLPKPPLPKDGDPKVVEWLRQNGVVTIAVQAFRLPGGQANSYPKINASSNEESLPAVLDGSWNTAWTPLPPADSEKVWPTQWILFDFGSPKVVDAAWVDSDHAATIEASEDNVKFKPVYTFQQTGYAEFSPQTARYFRVNLPTHFRRSQDYAVRELAIGTRSEVVRRAQLAVKTGLSGVALPVEPGRQTLQTQYTSAQHSIRVDFEFPSSPLTALPSDQVLPKETMVDLTGKLTADGILDWEVPQGRWRVVWLRRSVASIMEVGMGLPDYLSVDATREDFQKGMGKLGQAAGEKAGKILAYYHEDNNEIHSAYNWTPAMPEEFQKRRGYSAYPYLAALAGQIVDSIEVTDRFLTDFRRTIADCVAENHYGVWTELAHKQGAQTRSEAAGPYHPCTFSHDGMANLSRVDVVVGEFWTHAEQQQNWYKEQGQLLSPMGPYNERYNTGRFKADKNGQRLLTAWNESAQNSNVKMAASTSHLYGKRIVDTEAFTSLHRFWNTAPADLLLYANVAFCEGVNHMCFHASDTTAAAEGSPGNLYVGTHFNDKNTWWPQIGAFVQYIQRCSDMLQRGRFVADALYYIGDEVPALMHAKHIPDSLGFGYDYDDCNSEALLTRIAVKDGRLVTPDGMSYRLLVLPKRPTMTLAVAEKIRDLVAAGATVLGPVKPLRTPGLSGYPQCDAELKRIADELWDSGKIIAGKTAKEVLAALNTPVDFAFSGGQPDALLDFIHRQDGETEIYFVINRRNRAERVEATFRVTGKHPELWNAFTGTTADASAWRMADSRTTMPMELSAYGSVFVVFQKPATSPSKAGAPFVEFKTVQDISGPWQVQFDPKWGGPKDPVTYESLIDWTANGAKGIQYYSGTATYRKTFDLKPEAVGLKSLVLDLGVVNQVARVRLNGKDLGTVWCAPWRVQIPNVAKPGANELEIDVVNTWYNRLLLDLSLPKEKRLTDLGENRSNATWIIPKDGKGPLQPSGLLGPVRLMQENE